MTSSSVFKGASVRPDSYCNLHADGPLTEEEDGDFEEDSDDHDTAAFLAELEKIKKERVEDRPGRSKDKKLKKKGFG
ncbi:hypothetical protein GW7_00868 [Heterocephalus glaber]|uniref:Uncharacterized protein n=1 Tax=Heterocephalus glaber TaxID=10181 RepID=G5B8D5_HETGA|nr:hypothetical protein GW7_00868 [Heterocephalus glaber]